ncbi:MAG: metallophosphoesterase [Eubacterium sp.]|nr:metallophosphoesterase [Eubacterium sp.]
MTILLLADEELPGLWEYFQKEKLKGIDLILSCGDLKAEYLEFLVTMARCPLLYVHGNHDGAYSRHAPEGCENIDGKLYDFNGLRILGLGGSRQYSQGPHQYTEQEMRARIRKLTPRITMMNGFDLLLTHTPPESCGDLPDPAHRGFSCFNTLLNQWNPRYMVHGHIHSRYTAGAESVRCHSSGTQIINACGSYVLTISSDDYPEKGRTGSFLYDLYIQFRNR